MISFKWFKRVTDLPKLIKHSFCKHIRTLYCNLDQVQEVKTYSEKTSFNEKHHFKSRYDYQYILPILLGIYVLLDCIVIIVDNGGYSHTEMPQLFTHLISPREMWQTTDVIMGIGFLMFPSIYGRLLLCPKLSAQYQMYLLLRKHNTNDEMNTIKMYCGIKGKFLSKTILKLI